MVSEASVTSYTPSPSAVSKMSPATDSIVGWSNRSVYGNSIVNHSVRVFANSVAATESRPAAISGEFAAMAVSSTSNSDAEMLSATEEASCVMVVCQGMTSQRILFLEISSRELNSLLLILKESEMERSDGWSNSRVYGKSVRRRSASRVENSVA